MPAWKSTAIRPAALTAVLSLLLLIFGSTTASAADQPNILVIWGDDIGQSNISAYTFGLLATERRT